MNNLHDKLKAMTVGWQDIAGAPKDGESCLLISVTPLGIFSAQFIAEDEHYASGWKAPCTMDGLMRVEKENSSPPVGQPTHFAPLDSPDTATKMHEALMVAVKALEIASKAEAIDVNTGLMDYDAIMAIQESAKEALAEIEKILEVKNDE